MGLRISQMQLTSPAFAPSATIPNTYTCKGAGVSPPLNIAGVPPAAQSLALLLHDPDAPNGDFLHWSVWNLPPTTASLPESSLPPGAVQGQTDFGQATYGGPCPPPGQTHRYVFDLYALGAPLDLPPGAARRDLEAAMQGHTIAQASLAASFSA